MKIITLGASSAFAVGKYEQCVSVDQAIDLVMKFSAVANIQEMPRKVIGREIEKISHRLYAPRWQSNFLVEFDMPGKKGVHPYRLLVDAGGDVRHELDGVGLSAKDIDGVYISHPHNDHIGGMEFLALMTLFNPYYTPTKKEWLGDQFVVDKLFLEEEWWPRPPEGAKPDLFIHRKVLEPLKRALGPGLDTVQGVPNVTLETYFSLKLIGKQENGETKTHIFQDGDGHWTVRPIFAMHVISSSEEMASYGISFQHSGGYNVLMPTDTQHMMPPQLNAHYRRADTIYMDCETAQFPSGMHPHISDLMNRLDPQIQKKCLLYHYDAYPKVSDGMFADVLHAGDAHTYPE